MSVWQSVESHQCNATVLEHMLNYLFADRKVSLLHLYVLP